METYHTSVDYSLMHQFDPSYFIDTPSNFDILLQQDYSVSFYHESSKESVVHVKIEN